MRTRSRMECAECRVRAPMGFGLPLTGNALSAVSAHARACSAHACADNGEGRVTMHRWQRHHLCYMRMHQYMHTHAQACIRWCCPTRCGSAGSLRIGRRRFALQSKASLQLCAALTQSFTHARTHTIIHSNNHSHTKQKITPEKVMNKEWEKG